MDRCRFGLVGFGSIGRVRAQALARAPHCELAALYDADPARRGPAGTRSFDSAEALLEWDGLDAVIICTPPDSHAELAIRAMQAGKHVIVEKPIANTAQAMAAMLSAARQTGRVLTVGFNHRYFKGVERVRAAIERGEIGELRYVKAYAGHVGLPELRSPWMYDPKVMGGGTLKDNGIHLIDLVRHLMGDVIEVSALVPSSIWKLGVEENAFVHLHGANGVMGALHSSWTAWQGYKFKVEAYGTDGMAMMSYAPMYASVVRVRREPLFEKATERRLFLSDILREKAFGWQRTVIGTFVEEFNDFRALIANAEAKTRIASGHDGASAVAIANAAYESAMIRRAVAPLV